MAYSPVEWNTGDVITAAKLNNMDNGIADNESNIELLSHKIGNTFLIRSYNATFSIEASPGFTAITNNMLNRTPINGYKPIAILGFYCGTRYIVPFAINADYETSDGVIANLLNTSSNAISNLTFNIKILYAHTDFVS